MRTFLALGRLVTAIPAVPEAFEVFVDEELVHTTILLKILINGLSIMRQSVNLLRSRARNP